MITEASEFQIRAAHEQDAAAVAALLGELGYPMPEQVVRERLRLLATGPRDRVMVATADGEVVGVISTHVIPLLHREGVLGRITALVVRAEQRGRGVGAQLLRAAEQTLWAAGCERVEVTSGDRRTDAHRFYEREGYRTESRRFVKHRKNG